MSDWTGLTSFLSKL